MMLKCQTTGRADTDYRVAFIMQTKLKFQYASPSPYGYKSSYNTHNATLINMTA